MNFINFNYIYFLPLILVPFILEIIFRSKRKEMVFSSLFLIKIIAQKKNRILKIKNLLLLIIRTLIVLYIIFYFAKPYFGTKKKSNLNQSLYYLHIDTSPAMGNIDNNFTLLDRAKSATIKIVSEIKDEDDNYEILLTTSNPENSIQGNKKDILEYIKKLPNGYAFDDFKYWQKDAKLFFDKNKKTNKYIFYITNNIKKNDDQFILSNNNNLSQTIITTPIRNKEAFIDFSIDSVIVNNSLNNYSFLCYISDNSFGKINKSPQNISFFMEKKKIFQKDFIFKNSKKRVIEFKSNKLDNLLKRYQNKKQIISFYAKLNEDANNFNNIFYYTINLNTIKNKVLLVNGFGNENLGKKIGSIVKNDDNLKQSLEQIPAVKLSSMDLNTYDIIILNDLKYLSDYVVSRLVNNLKNGKSVFLILGKNLDLNNYNQVLVKKLFAPAITKIVNLDSSFAMVTVPTNDNKLFMSIFGKNNKLYSTEITKYFKISKSKKTKIFLSADTDPLFVGKKSYNGNMVLLTTGLEQWSNFIENGIIIPIFINGLNYLASQKSKRNNFYFVNQKTDLNLKSSKAHLYSPTDKKLFLDMEKFVIPSREVGFYHLINTELKDKFIFAVNSIRNQNFDTEFETDKAFVINDNELSKIKNVMDNGGDNSHYLLILLMLFISFEIILAVKK